MTVFSFFFRSTRRLQMHFKNVYERLVCNIILKGNGVRFSKSLRFSGLPIVDVHRTAFFSIGERCTINSGIRSNPIGRYTPSFFIVREHATLKIGNQVGMSSTSLICHKEISIGDNVKIGGGVCIYDTDFHALHPLLRMDKQKDSKNTKTKAVHIRNNVFIGAHSTVLKGVTIGENSIIGACSVVTKNIPANEIWAGNPARFIKKVDK